MRLFCQGGDVTAAEADYVIQAVGASWQGGLNERCCVSSTNVRDARRRHAHVAHTHQTPKGK